MTQPDRVVCGLIRRMPVTDPYRTFVVETRTKGYVIIHTREHQGIWTLRKLRKDFECRACGKEMSPGVEAYAPVTNGNHRNNRLCANCVEERGKDIKK